MDLSPWRDPLFWQFPIGAGLLSMAAFTAFAAPLTWLAWRDPPWARRWRIQQRPFHIDRFLGPSLRSWLVNNLLLTALTVIAWPLLRLSGVHGGPLPPIWLSAVQLVFFTFLDDALYYVMHRTLHRPQLFRLIHGQHHKVVTPFAATGHFMHPLEFVATAGLMLVGPLLLGVHLVTLYAWVVMRQWEAAEGHCGYRLPWSPTTWLPFGDGATHHDWHHARFTGNFAGYLPHLDRLFGTLAPGYRSDPEP